MKKKFLVTLLITLLTVFSFYFVSNKKSPSKPDLLVTIAPYKYFVDRLTDHSLNVKSLVPEESDPHGFEPSAKELMGLFSAKAWFLIGEPFEKHFLPIIQKNNPSLEAVHLESNIKTLKLNCPHHNHPIDDLHFWMSPKITKGQVQKIAAVLTEIYPEKAHIIERELISLNQDFDQLDAYLTKQTNENKTSFLLVSHPAFGYFCSDYKLKQLALENETQDTSPKELTQLFNQIKEHKIKRLYVQKQYNYKMAKITANSLDLEMVEVNPYKENYFENMTSFGSYLGD